MNTLTMLWEKFLSFLPVLALSLVVFLAAMLVVKILIAVLGKALDRSKIDKTAHVFLKSLAKVILMTLAIVISLSTLGVDMSSIVAAIGAAGLAVGLALQSSLSNVAGGFIILFSKPFKVGDYIESNGVAGTVESISILSTRLLTPDNKSIYIPNGQVAGSTVVNYSEEELRRVDFAFGIAYENDYKKAEEIILELAGRHPLALKAPEPFVRISEHASSSIIIAARVWTKSENYWDLYFDLMEQVKSAFDNNGISIPYSQLEVKIK